MNNGLFRFKTKPCSRRWRAACLLLTLCLCIFPGSAAAKAEQPAAAAQTAFQEKATAAPRMVKLTFQMGSFGTRTIWAEHGTYPTGVPEIPQAPAAQVLGWYDKSGEPAYPASYPATEDAVYTARWSRQVEDLLNTWDHTAYVSGYEGGVFKPNAYVTRAEAAQMFYSLLQRKDWDRRTFSDVGEKWYKDAVEVMAGLGILNGYTDGTFRPGRQITRAEFVSVAAACDTGDEGSASFADVPADFWGASAISMAAAKGWISGFANNYFRPNDKITRAQAVSVLNHMLGRMPDPDLAEKTDVKGFYDVFPEHWAYGAILEAAVDHYSYSTGTAEIWTDYTRRDQFGPLQSGWITVGSSKYYLDGSTGQFLRGEQVIDGKKYLLDSTTGEAVTGFRTQGSWRRYYQNGQLAEDISGLGVVSGPYCIKVYKNSNYLIVFAKDGSGNFNTPVRAMRTSCGEATITGTYYTPDKYRWLQMIGDTWAQWCTQIQGNYLFHSVPNWTQNNADLEVDEYNHLGETRSLGCIRLNCRDAKWLFDNCALGTKVVITTEEASGPLAKPAGIQIPSWHTWDPTDPTAYWRCQESGCH